MAYVKVRTTTAYRCSHRVGRTEPQSKPKGFLGALTRLLRMPKKVIALSGHSMNLCPRCAEIRDIPASSQPLIPRTEPSIRGVKETSNSVKIKPDAKIHAQRQLQSVALENNQQKHENNLLRRRELGIGCCQNYESILTSFISEADDATDSDSSSLVLQRDFEDDQITSHTLGQIDVPTSHSSRSLIPFGGSCASATQTCETDIFSPKFGPEHQLWSQSHSRSIDAVVKPTHPFIERDCWDTLGYQQAEEMEKELALDEARKSMLQHVDCSHVSHTLISGNLNQVPQFDLAEMVLAPPTHHITTTPLPQNSIAEPTKLHPESPDGVAALQRIRAYFGISSAIPVHHLPSYIYRRRICGDFESKFIRTPTPRRLKGTKLRLDIGEGHWVRVTDWDTGLRFEIESLLMHMDWYALVTRNEVEDLSSCNSRHDSDPEDGSMVRDEANILSNRYEIAPGHDTSPTSRNRNCEISGEVGNPIFTNKEDYHQKYFAGDENNKENEPRVGADRSPSIAFTAQPISTLRNLTNPVKFAQYRSKICSPLNLEIIFDECF